MASLALGSVQFGLAYGASNRRGQVPEDEVRRILAMAGDAGVPFIDTAAAYGEAEQVLGRCLAPEHTFRIISKSPPWRADRDLMSNFAAAEAALRDSLRALKTSQLDALLLHRGADLLEEFGPAVWDWLCSVRVRGVARRIGISVYSPEEAEAVAERYAIELVQVPGSVLDQRVFSSGALARLSARGIAVHLRSLFLQGLLLEPALLAERGAAGKQAAALWNESLSASGLTALQACLAWGLSRPVEAVVVGVSGFEEWSMLLAEAAKAPAMEFPAMACDDLSLLDPRQWAQ